MRAIFISYRRDDTEGYAGRLFHDLSERFGKDSVFMDVAGIEPGRDFRRVIEQQIASCGVLLAVIGKAWLTAGDAKGERRLNDPHDFVRLETASALKRDIPVIPVLVQQAAMPRAEELPDDLKDLAFRNSVELSHARWDSDVELLVAALGHHVDPSMPSAPATPPAPARPEPGGHQARVIVPLAALALAGIGYVAWDRWAPEAGATKDAASATPASAPAGVIAPPMASAPVLVAAPAAAPAPAPATAPSSTPAVRPVRAETTVARPGRDDSVAPQAAPARRLDRPVLAKTPPSAVAAPAPPARTTATAVTTPSQAARSAPVEAAAPAPAPAAVTATLVPAPAEAPLPEATPARRDAALDLLGGPASPSMATRTIFIKPETNYVNVTGGEVIRFEVGNKSFVWNFNGQRSSFDLARVAPPSLLDHKVTAYVAPNPMYLRRR